MADDGVRAAANRSVKKSRRKPSPADIICSCQVLFSTALGFTAFGFFGFVATALGFSSFVTATLGFSSFVAAALGFSGFITTTFGFFGFVATAFGFG
jgi:hypothetical protein